jgi:hypothetical protein
LGFLDLLIPLSHLHSRTVAQKGSDYALHKGATLMSLVTQ